MDWIPFDHHALVHLPVAAALLAPVALVAGLRGGRGIRPWWTAARLLLLAGTLGIAASLVSGLVTARAGGALPQGQWLAPGPWAAPALRLHQILALAALPLGLLALRATYRHRQDHQGLGLLPLVLGLLWSATVLTGGRIGGHLAHARPAAPAAAPAPPPPPPDPEAQAPLRALDYGRLEAAHDEPVKSPPHGNRWIRAWVTPGAGEAYAAGRSLPAGTMVVLSTLEDRWGRPGWDAGPLYILEVLPGGRTQLALYWPRVPEPRRGETLGADHAYWRGTDPGLKACLSCHAQGAAPARDRSQWKVPRRPKAEDPAPADAGGGTAP